MRDGTHLAFSVKTERRTSYVFGVWDLLRELSFLSLVRRFSSFV